MAFSEFAVAQSIAASSTDLGALEEDEARETSVGTVHETPQNLAVAAFVVAGSIASTDFTDLSGLGRSLSTTTMHGISSQTGPLSESPFERLDEMRGDDAKLAQLIAHITNSTDFPFAEKLARRLTFLIDVASEEGPTQCALSPESVRMFVKFVRGALRATPKLEYPDVMLSPSGNVRVQWRSAPNKHVAAEFYPDGEVRFVIFTPDLTLPDHTFRFSGVASVDTFLSNAKPHGVMEWMSDEG